MPNGGRINMGAYGGTSQASMSEWPIRGDVNQDGLVNMKDMALLAALLQGKLAESAETSVVLKAVSRVSHGTVVEVMDIVKGAGAKRLVVSTKPEQ